MFVINRDQVETLAQVRRATFHQRVLQVIRENWPYYITEHGEAAVREQVVAGHRRASRYRIDTERGVAKWVVLCLATQGNFEEDPAVNGYLKQPGADPNTKIDYLFDAIVAHLNQPAEG
jgi:hypothetical protein